MIKAVLFDMDGLLIDTEHASMESNFEAAEALGYPMTTEFFYTLLGTNRIRSEELYRAFIPNFEPEVFYETKSRIFWGKVDRHEVSVKQGAFMLLHFLQENGILRSVATSTRRQSAERILKEMDLFKEFNAIVTGEQTQRSKPYPDIFLRAAEELGVSPQECLVLEDSENGVKAGHAGGMKVCMVPDLLPYGPQFAPYCDTVCENLEEVIAFIQKENA